MERRYRETESEMVREELANIYRSSPVQECEGTRLRKEARHVFVDDKNLPEIAAYPIEKA